MSAAAALAAARAAGVGLRVDGRDLVLDAPSRPPQAVLVMLAQHKAGVIEILRGRGGGWSADEWREFYDERAAIAEFDGGFSREEAEALAHACCVAEWLARHPVTSPGDRCLWCGGAGDLLPFLADADADGSASGHAWLHRRCWDDWQSARRAEATDALAAMGIVA